MRTLFLRLFNLYTKVISLFYFLGYFIWYWKKPESAYNDIIALFEKIVDEKYSYRYNYDKKSVIEKSKIITSFFITISLIWILILAFSPMIALLIMLILIILFLIGLFIYLLIAL